jgi:methionyl-tRNA formyltransferase
VNKDNYIVAATKPWSIKAYKDLCEGLPNWFLITQKEELSLEFIDKINPRYIFFPHWNWIVPNTILSKYESVCFHMTDVPYGRGGSPLQNLIIRGHKETQLTALKMTNDLDAGPVYLKEPLSLHGSADDVFNRTAPQIMELAFKIAKTNPDPKEQKGEVTIFERRKPSDSEVVEELSLEQLYDFIRMLDADTYPKAFINFRGYRFEFDKAKLDSIGKLEARVIITGSNE